MPIYFLILYHTFQPFWISTHNSVQTPSIIPFSVILPKWSLSCPFAFSCFWLRFDEVKSHLYLLKQYCFLYPEIQMVDLEKHLLQTESEEETNEWIKNLHRVAVSLNICDITSSLDNMLTGHVKTSVHDVLSWAGSVLIASKTTDSIIFFHYSTGKWRKTITY